MRKQEWIYKLALQKAPFVGDITAKKLIRTCGSAEAVFHEKKENLEKIDGIGTVVTKSLNNKELFSKAESEWNYIQENQIDMHYFEDDSYPYLLKQCIDAPILLFTVGNFNLFEKRIISVVGTRKISSTGIAFCEKLINDLAHFNPIIVSGMAYGTDICAHKAALENNLQTIACMAHGYNQFYPKSHHKYKEQVVQNGGFMSDFWSSDDFDRKNFLKRNRIIAGLSEATIVVESAQKGGSLVTADMAFHYNREVFAVPGKPKDKWSVGCNNLIKFGKAHLLSDPLDVASLLNWDLDKTAPAKPIQKQLFVELNDNEKKIYNLVKEKNKLHLDAIALHCQLPVYSVSSILLDLELKGLVRPLPGKQFEWV